MREQVEGSRAIAEAVARCRPEVIPAYPITPQTHIVEALGAMVRTGELPGCDFITVESEFAAMSAAIGASAAGARTYTATASQGLLYMAEALFNAAGLGVPIVMTVANRAIGAPINIWNDQSDSMSMRDAGWVQLYAEDNQAAVGLHIVAFRLAEQLSVPVMVCVDGFVLTHAVEPVDVPDAASIDSFLPRVRPRQRLDPDGPLTIGAMVGPEAFTEVRYLADHDLRRATTLLPAMCSQYWAATGHRVAPMTGYSADGARTVIVALGSVTGTIRTALEESPSTDIGLLALTQYRPFPAAEVQHALRDAEHVIVLERAFSPGAPEGPVTADIRAALAGSSTTIRTVVAGLGGRPVTRASLQSVFASASRGDLPPISFLDLDTDVVARELHERDLRDQTAHASETRTSV